jgi:thiol-disulfide isomerase/thioredoxin
MQILNFYILLSSCTNIADKNSREFTLRGEYKSQDSGIVVLTYYSEPDLISDTAKIEKGQFIFIGRISEPTQATLRDKNDSELAVVYLEPRRMKLSIVKDKPLGCIMTGSKTQTEFSILNKREEHVYEKLTKLREQEIMIIDSLKNIADGPDKFLLEEKRKEINSLWSVARNELNPIELKFVLENPESFVSPLCLDRLIYGEAISLDSAKSIFNGFDTSIKQSRKGKAVSEVIRKKENIRIGNQAPDFKATALNNQQLKLSQFKGTHVVLLDFWASWCVPCRKSFPHLKTIYKEYHARGLEIIAVSVDGSRTAWMGAVKSDSIDMWRNIMIAEKWPDGPITNDDIFQNYDYTAIPEQLLIDKNGKIIYRNVGYSKESEESLDRLLDSLLAIKN